MTRLVTTAEIATELDVPPNRVRSWYRRRDSNGFPEHVVRRTTRNGIPDARHFNLAAVLAWYAAYRPKGQSGTT